MASSLSVNESDVYVFDADKSFTLYLRRQYRKFAEDRTAHSMVPLEMLLEEVVWRIQGWRPEQW